MNIIKRELKNNLKSFIFWSLALSLIFLTASSEFEAYYGNQEIIEALENFGQFFEALGVSIEDMTTPTGFLILVSIYIYLPLSIYAALLGSNILSKEEKDKTAEFLFTMPVTRKKVITAKLIVALIYVILLDLVAVLINVVAYLRFDLSSEFYQFILFLFIGVLLTELIFMFIGMFLASLLDKYKLAGAITIGLIIATFMISMLIGFVEEAAFLRFITPFEYFSATKMSEHTFKPVFVIITLMIISASFYGIYFFYQRRDLTL